MLREEPVDNQPTFRLSNLDTVVAVRGRLIEVMEKMACAGKIDDGVTFTNLFEKQLKPLLRTEARLRKAAEKNVTENHRAAMEPVVLEWARDMEKQALHGGKVRKISVDFENERMRYRWETEDAVHQSEWYPLRLLEKDTS